MSIGQTIKHKIQALKGRGTERIGRTTRNRRLQHHGRTDQISGNLKQVPSGTIQLHLPRPGAGPPWSPPPMDETCRASRPRAEAAAQR